MNVDDKMFLENKNSLLFLISIYSFIIGKVDLSQHLLD